MSFRRNFTKHWFAIEAIPLYVVLGGTCVGATWYLWRLAMGPHVVWTKNNPQPWNTIKKDESVKMMNVNEDLTNRWGRGKF
ncbi:hypothetical protein K488DRAFT_82833 [Vararia minispora EC-137]|uniref:Uncharacterized protein n=1 Tax=Vararia minispora EC-137 TaxID=1314806 RepID=A0ACB8QUY1_9AGAM|nr:hypothetical protein K488DRAFT_82833 [Vararia minispora EC-137]